MQSNFSRYRLWIVVAALLLIVLALLIKTLYLQTIDHRFLRNHFIYHTVHYHKTSAFRGTILSRNRVPLAISAPVDDIILSPKVMRKHASQKQLAELAKLRVMGLPLYELKAVLSTYPHSEYYPVKRNVPPYLANQVSALDVPGVYTETHWRTFYPLGASAAQFIGFTNSHNVGQDGIELAYNSVLQAHPGLESVVTNGLGEILHVKNVHKKPQHGHNLVLSIDSRIQQFAYDALKKYVSKTHAHSGSAVVLNPRTGEVLAAATYPSFNPNSFQDRTGSAVRARSLTDAFEPGSTIKVLTIAAALASGKYKPNTIINTSPGWYYLDGNEIKDDADFGVITLTGILTKSSNVGISKTALSLNRQKVYDMFTKAGIGTKPAGKFPGETAGLIHSFATMGAFEFATMTFGYAFTLSVVQLASIYGAIANHGIQEPISYLKVKHPPKGKRLMSAKIAKEIIAMLHTVVEPGGTGILANIPGYCVAGKTGTSYQVGAHGFYKHRYNAVFAGIVPCRDPRLAIVVRINDPVGGYNEFGGVSAAPVFAQVAQRSMQILGIQPHQTHINHLLLENKKSFAREIAGD